MKIKKLQELLEGMDGEKDIIVKSTSGLEWEIDENCFYLLKQEVKEDKFIIKVK